LSKGGRNPAFLLSEPGFSDADLIQSKLCSDSDRFPGNQKKEIKNGKLEMH
jgi:hypothetical protein